MQDLINQLKEMERYLKELFKQIDQEAVPPIEGRLLIRSTKKGHPQYYHVTKNPDNQKEMRYLPAKEISVAQSIAKRDYLVKLEKVAKRRLPTITRLRTDLEQHDIEGIYDGLAGARKALFSPLVATKEERLRAWIDVPYVGLTFRPETPRIMTRKQERVRSKSEKILADLFDEMGIQYKYECPLFLNDDVRFYPDFTFLDLEKDQEIYWEHFGMVDNPGYAENMIKKLNIYAANGIVPGKRLILTLESSNHVLDASTAKRLVHLFLRNCTTSGAC